VVNAPPEVVAKAREMMGEKKLAGRRFDSEGGG